MSPSGRDIPDEESVYRRIPLVFYDPRATYGLKIDVFLPTREDRNGLSVHRCALTSIEEAARGMPGKRYHVVRLSVGELRRLGQLLGCDVAPDPFPANPAHALIPQINRDAYMADKPAFKALANVFVTELMKPASGLGEIVLVALDPADYPDQPEACPRAPEPSGSPAQT